MRTARDLVVDLATARRPRPALTWYGADGERAELSERVLATWAVKAANLLIEEADAGPGTTLLLDLPTHWRTLVWALGGWTAGAAVALAERAEGRPPRGADVVATDRPAHRPRATGAAGAPALVLAVALPALATRFPGPVPEGVLDAAAELMAAPDALTRVPPLDRRAPALVDGPDHADLLTWCRDAAGAVSWPASPRMVLDAGRGTAQVLGQAVAAWSAAGSVVLVADASADLGAIADTERGRVAG